MRFLAFILLLTPGMLLAAPHPATSTSTVVDANRGLVRSRLGFRIDAFLTDWKLVQSPSKISGSIHAMYRSPVENQGVQPTLTARVDQMKKELSPAEYFRRWKADYPRFGFDLYRSEKLRISGQIAQVVDFVQSQQKRQLRQYIFTKNKTAVVLTCRDHHSTFEQTVKTCNQLARNFRWE